MQCLLRSLLSHPNCAHRLYSTAQSGAKVCIVGSGPAGFYTAQQILKNDSSVHVDIYEKLPVPFGLVRYGVAPDHPDVKNVENTFSQTASNERCRFLGNVTVGRDVTISQLRNAYNAVILAYGAAEDRKLDIPGENVKNVISARTFVGWYNGLPEDKHLLPDLECTDTAVVIGHGNVAVDVARILLTPLSILQKTDISDHALSVLEKSRIRRVHLVGRRGPIQAAFTIKEFRELTKLPGTRCLLDPDDFQGLDDFMKTVKRPRKRLTELMIKTASTASINQSSDHELRVRFLRAPERIMSRDDGWVEGVQLTVNTLQGPVGEQQKAVPTSESEFIHAGLVLTSIGYKSSPLDDSTLPFNHQKGLLINHNGRVQDECGVYCSGWVKTGPVGVILSTMTDAFSLGKTVLTDIQDGRLGGKKDGFHSVAEILNQKGVQPVTWSGWLKINAEEIKMASGTNRPRCKISDIHDMLKIATS